MVKINDVFENGIDSTRVLYTDETITLVDKECIKCNQKLRLSEFYNCVSICDNCLDCYI